MPKAREKGKAKETRQKEKAKELGKQTSAQQQQYTNNSFYYHDDNQYYYNNYKGGKAKAGKAKGKGKGKTYGIPYEVPPHDANAPVAWTCVYCTTKHNSDFCWVCRNLDCRMPRPDEGAEEYGPDPDEWPEIPWGGNQKGKGKGAEKGLTRALATIRDSTTQNTWGKYVQSTNTKFNTWEDDDDDDHDRLQHDGFDDYDEQVEEFQMNDGNTDQRDDDEDDYDDDIYDITTDEIPIEVKTAKKVLKDAKKANASTATLSFLTAQLQEAKKAQLATPEDKHTEQVKDLTAVNQCALSKLTQWDRKLQSNKDDIGQLETAKASAQSELESKIQAARDECERATHEAKAEYDDFLQKNAAEKARLEGIRRAIVRAREHFKIAHAESQANLTNNLSKNVKPPIFGVVQRDPPPPQQPPSSDQVRTMFSMFLKLIHDNTTQEEKEGSQYLNRIMDMVAPGIANPMENAPPLPADFLAHGALPAVIVAHDAEETAEPTEPGGGSHAQAGVTAANVVQVSDVEPTGGTVTPDLRATPALEDATMDAIAPFSDSDVEPDKENKKAIEINSIAPVADKALRAAGEIGTAKGGGRDTVAAKAAATGVTKDNIKAKEKVTALSESTSSKGGSASSKKGQKKK